MQDLTPGDIFTNETRRCVNCGGNMKEGGMLQAGVHCFECMPVLGKYGTYKTLAHWKLSLLFYEHFDTHNQWYHCGRDIIISTDARLKFFTKDKHGDKFYYLAYE